MLPTYYNLLKYIASLNNIKYLLREFCKEKKVLYAVVHADWQRNDKQCEYIPKNIIYY